LGWHIFIFSCSCFVRLINFFWIKSIVFTCMWTRIDDHANDVTPPPELKHLSRSVFKILAENVRHENKTLVRNSKPPDAAEMMALRVIILITVFGAILKDILQVYDFNLLLVYILISKHWHHFSTHYINDTNRRFDGVSPAAKALHCELRPFSTSTVS
jgi:hypothetical protein